MLFNTGSGYKYLEAWQAALPEPTDADTVAHRSMRSAGQWSFLVAGGHPARPGTRILCAASLGLLVWMAWWWMAEPVHLAVTALLPIVSCPSPTSCRSTAILPAYSEQLVFLHARRQHARHALETLGAGPAYRARLVDGHRHRHSTAIVIWFVVGRES